MIRKIVSLRKNWRCRYWRFPHYRPRRNRLPQNAPVIYRVLAGHAPLTSALAESLVDPALSGLAVNRARPEDRRKSGKRQGADQIVGDEA
jgi:hypothetical protein